MKSLRNQSTQPASVPLIADDILEFHAARVLLLIAICGTNDAISSLTKLAKLDFFVRYPDFFLAAAIADDKSVSAPGARRASKRQWSGTTTDRGTSATITYWHFWKLAV
jgi:hypothetical protein